MYMCICVYVWVSVCVSVLVDGLGTVGVSCVTVIVSFYEPWAVNSGIHCSQLTLIYPRCQISR